jgi:3-deoxy-7-phosphoheptulonate synthase
MSFKYIREIPTVNDILKEMPLDDNLKKIKELRDVEIRDVFKRKDNRFLVIIGPCSADNEDAVCQYTDQLAKLQEKTKDVLLIVPRVYTNKPRTTGVGYKGMAHQPNLDEEPNIVEGIKAIRKMHIRILNETGLTAADEMLYPSNYPYLEDILGYVAIGARSVENQQHRLTVSGLDIPVGMKNPTSGDLGVMLNSVQAAVAPHTFIYKDWEVKTTGNPYTHCILRGAVDHHGHNIPNFHYESLIECTEMYLERKFPNPTIIVDASHANSNKKFSEQPRVCKEVMESLGKSKDLKGIIKGLMIESYLVEGNQPSNGKVFGQSITDSCLGWEDSQKLILELADQVSKL